MKKLYIIFAFGPLQVFSQQVPSCLIICPPDIQLTLGPGECEKLAAFPVPVFSSDCDTLVQTCGPSLGTPLPPGVYPVCFEAMQQGEPADACTFNLIVHPYSGPVSTSLTCNNLIQVSLDQSCRAAIGADDILEGGPYRCYDEYLVFVQGVPGNVNGIPIEYSPGLYNITITDPFTNNSCWGNVRIEDKLKPVIQCVDVTVECGESTAAGDNQPIVSDNCDDEVTLTHTDMVSGNSCNGLTINRTWKATDDGGNMATCIQHISIQPLDLSALVCPPAYLGSCGDDIDPENTGYPTINGVDIAQGGHCNIFSGYWDLNLVDCGGGSKIVRSWTVLDWCSQQVVECVQVLKLQDMQAPIITCPANITVGSDPWFCHRDVVIPQPAVYDACGSPFSLSLNAGVLQSHISGSSPYLVINDIPLGTHIIYWVATDVCGNASSCAFTITVIDDIPPVAICDEHTVVSLIEDHKFDRGLTKIPASVLDDGSYDNCGPVTFLARRMDSCIDFDWTTNGAGIDEIPNSVIDSRDRGTVHRPLVPFTCCDVHNTVMVELQVTDAAGNINFCMVEVKIQDKLAPFVLCPPDITVSCDFWFAAEATPGFIPQEDDILTPVFGRMLDAYDFDQVHRQPIIINDPGNTQVSQPHNWGLDGWTDDNCDVNIDVRVRLFEDCSGVTLPSPHPANATRLVERTFRATDDWGNTTTCRQLIWVVDFKPFFITDQTCTNVNPNDGVIWPCDKNYTTCPSEIPVDYPVLFDDNCSLIGVAYSDQVFQFVENACYKILRKWVVIDWCQFNAVTGAGKWQYIQIIKVVDNQGPVFSNCPNSPVVLCADDDEISLPANNQVFLGEANPSAGRCSVHVRLEHELTEVCSDFVKFDVKVFPNDGSQYIQVTPLTQVPLNIDNNATLVMDTRTSGNPSIKLNGLPYNDRFCSNYPLPGGSKDYHRVLWTVEDGCGNVSTCEYLFRLEDCKKPTPICINGLSSVVMPSAGEVTIWAKDFDASSFDDCSLRENLQFSFSGDSHWPSAKFACDCSNVQPDYPGQPCFDLITNGGPSFLLQVWVADEGTDDNCNGQITWNERNKDYCTTFIVINDNANACSGGASPITGSILTEEGEPIELVSVSVLDQSGALLTDDWTEKDGIYTVHINNPAAGWTIAPKRLDDPRNGVSTIDLLRIQKHLLGIEKFDNPLQLIAADANNSQTVSAVDLIELRKLILGIYSELPSNTSWRFVGASQQFADPNQPWAFSEQIFYNGEATDMDFIGVKVGDVNGTVVANANEIQVRNTKGKFWLSAMDRYVQAGETLAINFNGSGNEAITGFQFTMMLADLWFEGVNGGAADLHAGQIGVFDEAITISWFAIGGVDLHAGPILFTLHFKAIESGMLSSMLTLGSLYTVAEAYDGGEELLDIGLEWRQPLVEEGGFALFQNVPNPFNRQTLISFDAPASMPINLTVHDMTGKVVIARQGIYPAGRNALTIGADELPAGGMYYYSITAEGFSATRKMLFMP